MRLKEVDSRLIWSENDPILQLHCLTIVADQPFRIAVLQGLDFRREWLEGHVFVSER